MIYSFFDPDHAERHGLGNFIIMDHILRARAVGLPYIYLGYWVKGTRSMAYKTRYRPIEVLGPHGWRLMPKDEEAPVKRLRAAELACATSSLPPDPFRGPTPPLHRPPLLNLA